jgi:hypothetical protein
VPRRREPGTRKADAAIQDDFCSAAIARRGFLGARRVGTKKGQSAAEKIVPARHFLLDSWANKW